MNFAIKALGERVTGLLKTVGEKASTAAIEIREQADRAAEAVAAKCTEVTGHETTAAEVRCAAAMVAGAIVLAAGALAFALTRRRDAIDGVGSGLSLDWHFDGKCRPSAGYLFQQMTAQSLQSPDSGNVLKMYGARPYPLNGIPPCRIPSRSVRTLGPRAP